MDCFHDFCLFCDRDSPDGPYCSQQCKLADLERANSSPSSPTSPTSGRSWNSSSYQMQAYTSSQQHRTPGYDAPSSQSSRPRSSFFMWNPSQQLPEHSVDERQLTPSSSRTSLSSTSSVTATSSTGSAISLQNKQQLQEYFNSLDQAKAAKRRSSLR